MTDAEKLSALETAALYQRQLDVLTRDIATYQAQLNTWNQQKAAKQKQLDDQWAFIQSQVNSGQ